MQKKLEKIITKKLTEHISIIESVQEEFDKLKEKMKEKKDIEIGWKLSILKDKILFHKACSAVLQDVLDEANK